jgi:Sulfotransferase family
MMISLAHKLAFLCVPKCGSTSVERVLKNNCEILFQGHPSVKHINVRQYELLIRPLLRMADPTNKIETFCIIRDPVDRLRSWYDYQTRPELANPKHPGHARYTGNIDFNHFIESYLSDERPQYACIGTQHEFLSLANGKIGVDRIFRLDQMKLVAEFLSNKLGNRVKIPQINRSTPMNKVVLEPSLASRLCEFLRLDYELYESIGGAGGSSTFLPDR